MDRLPPRTGQTLTGMVKSYNRKGFGFIMCQAIDQDIYFSRESLHPQLQTSDLAGENVTFEIHKFPDGKLQARNLRAVGDVSDFRGGGYSGSRRPPPPPPRMTTSAIRGSKEEEDRSRDWYCTACGERNFVKRNECFKCKTLRPRGDGSPPPANPGPPRRTLSPHAGSRAMREALRAGMCQSRSRSRKKKREQRKRSSRKSSASSSSSGSSRKRSKKSSSRKGKNSKSRSRSSSASCVSSSSSSAGKGKSAASALESELQDSKKSPEIEKAKAEVLEKLMKLREVEPREARVREWRALLREWHPDKNPERVEVATAVFQFLQKGKLLIDAAK